MMMMKVVMMMKTVMMMVIMIFSSANLRSRYRCRGSVPGRHYATAARAS